MPEFKNLVGSLLVGLVCVGCTSSAFDNREEEKSLQNNHGAEMPDADDTIDAWWSAFEAKADDIDGLFSRKAAADWGLAEWMQENLQQVHPQLMWEYGRAIHTKGHRLVITPESRRDLRPLVDSILKRAPKLDRWEFYGYRLAEDYEMTVQTVKSRSEGDIRNTSFRAAIGDYNRIDLVFLAEGYSENDQQALHDVFVAAETLLGEEVLDKWIGAIEVGALPASRRADNSHIKALKTGVDALIEQVRSGLPDQPYHRLSEEQQWTLFELKPEKHQDYSHQSDMFVGKAMIQEMWQNAHSNQPFDSIRFSTNGEIFCYVKIDGSVGLEDERFADKSEIEDTLDAALREADIGCYIGGGTGLIYSYVDLVLTDLERGTSIIRRILQEGQIPKRSWLLFFDTDLQTRWIGIWDDTPPPPIPDFE